MQQIVFFVSSEDMLEIAFGEWNFLSVATATRENTIRVN